MKVRGNNPTAIELPGGKVIASGATVTLTQDEAELAKVQQWLAKGRLVEIKTKKAAKK